MFHSLYASWSSCFVLAVLVFLFGSRADCCRAVTWLIASCSFVLLISNQEFVCCSILVDVAFATLPTDSRKDV